MNHNGCLRIFCTHLIACHTRTSQIFLRLPTFPSMWTLFSPSNSTTGRYRRTKTLSSHTRAVLSLDFNDSGEYLASGGEYPVIQHIYAYSWKTGCDGAMIWDMKTKTSLRTPDHRDNRGAVTQVMWVATRARGSTLFSGTDLGHLSVWAQNEDMVS